MSATVLGFAQKGSPRWSLVAHYVHRIFRCDSEAAQSVIGTHRHITQGSIDQPQYAASAGDRVLPPAIQTIGRLIRIIYGVDGGNQSLQTAADVGRSPAVK